MKIIAYLIIGLIPAQTAFAEVWWSWDQSLRMDNHTIAENGFTADRLRICGTQESTIPLFEHPPAANQCRTYPDISPYYFQGSRQDWVNFFDRCQNFEFLNTGVRLAHSVAFILIFRRAAVSRSSLSSMIPNRASRLGQRIGAGRDRLLNNTIRRVIPQRLMDLSQNRILKAASNGLGAYALADLLPDAYPQILDEAIADARHTVLEAIDPSNRTFPQPRERLLAHEKVIQMCSFALKSSIQQRHHRSCMGGCHEVPASENPELLQPAADLSPPTLPLVKQAFEAEAIENYLEKVSASSR